MPASSSAFTKLPAGRKGQSNGTVLVTYTANGVKKQE